MAKFIYIKFKSNRKKTIGCEASATIFRGWQFGEGRAHFDFQAYTLNFPSLNDR
jgi:hypothetical protein